MTWGMNVSVKKPKARWRFKNLQENGQTPNTMHENRANGIPDKLYPVRNVRAVWSINTKPFNGAHFAVYPEKLVERMLKSGCPKNGTVLDPFSGAQTTALVARKLGINYLNIELNKEFIDIGEKRLKNELGLFE